MRPGQASHAQTVQTLKGFGKDPRVLEKTFGLQPCLGCRSTKKRSPGEVAPLPTFARQRGPIYSGTTWKSKVLTLTHQEAWLNMLLLWKEQEPLEKGTSSRGRSSTPKAKPLEKGQRASRSSSKKGKPLEKGKGKGQGKGPGTTRSRSTSAKEMARRARARRGRRGRRGLRAKALEKAKSQKRRKNVRKSWWKRWKSQRKRPRRRSTRPTTSSVLEKIPENEVKQNDQQALEKARDKLKKTYKGAVVQSPKLPAKKACILKPAYGLLNHHRL